MVTSTTARVDIYEEFYDVINDNIVTVGVEIGAAFKDDEASFPQIVIHIPLLGRTRESFGTLTKAYDRTGSIDIEVFAEDPQELAALLDDIEQAIFNNQTDISVQNIQLGTASEITIPVGSKTVSGNLLPISFRY